MRAATDSFTLTAALRLRKVLGNRLSKIYTRTGDDGTTGLGDGQRVRKDDLRVEAFGTVDEVNSLMGMIAAQKPPADMLALIEDIQHKLFDLGGELCIPGSTVITAEDVTALEASLDTLNEHLPALKEFVLPGGNAAASVCHVARTVCRRAERRVISLAEQDTINEHAARYLNRLSDLLFVMARTLNIRANNPEVLWSGGRPRG